MSGKGVVPTTSSWKRNKSLCRPPSDLSCNKDITNISLTQFNRLNNLLTFKRSRRFPGNHCCASWTRLLVSILPWLNSYPTIRNHSRNILDCRLIMNLRQRLLLKGNGRGRLLLNLWARATEDIPLSRVLLISSSLTLHGQITLYSIAILFVCNSSHLRTKKTRMAKNMAVLTKFWQGFIDNLLIKSRAIW